jgi:peptidoglycan/LPS O-acetylase OafA/YrhL
LRSGPGVGYRPHLDGLRAVAVYLVVLFHAGVDRFSGGFIGVDVFFVLSGYLVTQLLMRDLSVRGAVRFGRFYARRMRRLLPASAVLLLVTAVVYSALASPAEIVKAVGSFKAAFLYVANWYFIRQSADYFGADINANPVIHFWSLAIEEQFYLVWPVLLGGLFAATRRLGRHAHRVMQVVVAGAGFASLLWALSLAGSNLNRAYYGTDARAYQLLAGALLALSPGLVRRAARFRGMWVVAGVALVALLAAATSRVDVSVIDRGIAATVITSVLIVAIEAARRGPVNGLLSCGPVVYLGKISYGTYLWHWPVILVALDLTDAISPLSLFAIAALVATGLASLSYHVLERPIREQRLLDRVSPVVIAAGLTITVVCALVVIPYILDPYRAQATTAVQDPTKGFTPVPALDFVNVRHDFGPDLEPVSFIPTWNCFGRPAAACTIVKGTGQHLLVIGDSHADMMFPTFAKIALDHNLTLSTAASPGCPWQRNTYLSALGTAAAQLKIPECTAMKADLYERVIPELKPDVIVAVASDYLDYPGSFPGAVHVDGRSVTAESGTDFRVQIKADTVRSLKALEATGSKVLIMEPSPIDTSDDPFACLTKSKVLEECRFVADQRSLPQKLMYRGLADDRSVYVANFDELICPFMPICDPVVKGQIVRFDEQHITPRFAVTLAEPIAAFLQDDRLIP